MRIDSLVCKLLVIALAVSVSYPIGGTSVALASGAAPSQDPGSKPQGQDNATAPEDMPLIGGSLLAKARAAGSLLVLAELALPAPFVPEAQADAQAALEQRAAIAATSDAVLAALKGTGAQVAATFSSVPYLAVRVDANALATLANLPQVASIQEDVPAAPALESSTQAISLPPVWASGIEGQGQTVVLLDTGIDTDHPFYASRLVDGACFSNAGGAGARTPTCPNASATQYGVAAAESDSSNAACWSGGGSLCAHGTHVAGVAAGGDANTFDGVARQASIIAIQVFTRFDNYAACGGNGTCVMSYTTDQLRALDYVYTTLRPARTLASVNMSLGGGQYTAACDFDARKPAIDNLRSAGIATTVAAGNNNFRNALTAPACISTAVAVGGVTDSDNPPANSVVFNLHSLVDLLAPGYSVVSSAVGGGYGGMSGTSVSSPFVAGAFALCKSAHPALSVNQIETILEQTGAPVHDARSSGVYTKPRLKLDDAVAACQQVAMWTGAADGAWNNPANWSSGALPGPATFVNIPAAPSGGRFPTISGAAEMRSVLLEPDAQINLSGATLTLHGSLEALGAARITAGSSTVVMTGNQLAALALPAGQKLNHVQIGSGSDTFLLSLDSASAAIDGNLTVRPGALLDVAGSALSVQGVVTNQGALRQSLPVTSDTVEFLRIKDAAGAATRYWGVDIAPSASMGYTAVTVRGNQTCEADGAGVRRCYDVTPATASPSTLTLYYAPEEANGVAFPAGYHWSGSTWEGPMAGTCGSCGPALFVIVQGVTAYSAFSVRDGSPLAVTLASLTAEARPGQVLVAWETTSELNTLGFSVLRSTAPDASPERMAFVPSQSPGSAAGASYGWQDVKVEAGATYWYWIEDIDLSGVATRHGPVAVTYALRSP